MVLGLLPFSHDDHQFQDELLYQEARRLVGAEMQNIAYGEYLPTILGVDYMQKYKLVVAEESKYDPTVDSTIFNRSGHLN